MLLSSMAPVFAETTTTEGSITIKNTVAGQTYTIYRMFDLESYDVKDPENEKFSYKVCGDWRDFFVSGDGANYINLDDGGYIADASNAEKDPQAFAKAALVWTEGKVMTFKMSKDATGDSLSFGELPLGYYLVDSTLGTMCILETNIKDLTIEDKNKEATLIFTIKNGVNEYGLDTFGDIHDADMNSTLTYKIDVLAKTGAENYQIFVKKPDGIDANLQLVKDSIEVIIQPELVPLTDEENPTYPLSQGVHYNVYEQESPNNIEVQESEYSFRIEIEQTLLDQIQKDALITITYNAQLTTEAAWTTLTDASKNTSTAWMIYGGTSEAKTSTEETSVYTYHLPIFKYTGDIKNPTALSGAKFCLYRESNDANAKYASFEDGKFVGWTTEGRATVLTSDDNGMIDVYGLGTGTYYLEETAAPAGYNKLIKPITVQISAGKEQRALYAQDGGSTPRINVLNNTGSQLPSTGGMGTKIFYALGATMFVSAVILLVVRKRMSK